MTQVTPPADIASRRYERGQLVWRNAQLLVPGLDLPVTKTTDDPKTGHSLFRPLELLDVQRWSNGWTELTMKWSDRDWLTFQQPPGHPVLIVVADVLAEDPTWPWVN